MRQSGRADKQKDKQANNGGQILMRTDSFAEFLARGAESAPRHVVARRLGPGVLVGVAVSVALALLVVGPLPATVFASPAPWIKLAYVICLFVPALVLMAGLARPLSRSLWPLVSVAVVFACMMAWGSLELLGAAQSDRSAILFGQTWLICPWMVLGLSVPALASLLWAVRGLAATRLRLASAGAGFLAGSAGALGYSLVCPESSVMFVAIWYSLGILLSTILGALAGPRFISW